MATPRPITSTPLTQPAYTSPPSVKTDGYTGAYYADQRNKISDSYQIGLTDNADKAAQAASSWQDRIQQLDTQLANQRSQFGDRFAQRGLLDSGIYNYGSKVNEPGGGLGALQQFGQDAGRQTASAANAAGQVAGQYMHQQQGLDNTMISQTNSLNNVETQDALRQNIASAVTP